MRGPLPEGGGPFFARTAQPAGLNAEFRQPKRDWNVMAEGVDRRAGADLALDRTSEAGAAFLAGGGEVGALMRVRDWSESPLGPPDQWPQSLRTVVGLLLNSKFPMFVAWGDELGFLYNDPYAEILGAKHPRALGRPFRDIWP